MTVVDLQGLKREKEIKIIVNVSVSSFRIIDVLSVGKGPHPHLLLVEVGFLQYPEKMNFQRLA